MIGFLVTVSLYIKDMQMILLFQTPFAFGQLWYIPVYPVIDIYIFQLYIFKNMLDLAGKIMNSEDEDAISLRSGSRAVFNSYYNFTVFLLEEQLKSDVYSESDIERLSDAVAESLQLNKGWFESSDKQKINSLMEGVLEKTTSGIIRDNCRKSLEAFEN